jgi:hypothetical protein
MKKNISIPLFGILCLIGLAWLLFGYFGVQALFMDTVVQEEIPPFSSTSSSGAVPVVTPLETSASSTPPNPPAIPILPVVQGMFEQGDSTYTVQGKASILKQGGESLLTLTDFAVTNGPDLFVYLVSASSTDNTIVKAAVRNDSFVQVAPLKGNRGNQVYRLPKDVVITDDTIVTIWCKRFSRHFGSAELAQMDL